MKNEKFYKEVSIPLKEWILKTFKTQSEAATRLGIDPTHLSKILHGDRTPNSNITLKLIRSGFDKEHFDKYYLLEKMNPEQLTNQELIKFFGSQSLLIEQQREMIIILSDRLQKANNDNDRLRRELTQLLPKTKDCQD